MTDLPEESHHERIRRLEEAAAFADRHAEQLSQQIVEVWARIDALASRLGHMESRLTEMHQSIADQQPGDQPIAGSGDGLGTSDPGPGRDPEVDDNQHLRAHRPPHWDGRR